MNKESEQKARWRREATRCAHCRKHFKGRPNRKFCCHSCRTGYWHSLHPEYLKNYRAREQKTAATFPA
jgi:hypothetical protein